MASVEAGLLRNANTVLNRARDDLRLPPTTEARLSILEGVASAVAGWDPEEYQRRFGLERTPIAVPWAEKLIDEIGGTGIPIPLALTALSREELVLAAKRKTGAYYTDWRLAEELVGQLPQEPPPGLWVDPACGTGILLVAMVMRWSSSPLEAAALIRERICAADLSAVALRGLRLSLSSLTPDLSAIQAADDRTLCMDSLRSADAWSRLAPQGFSVVVGNPPWEKLKVSRHEIARTNGSARSYGQAYTSEDEDASTIVRQRRDLTAYVAEVASGRRLQGKGEHDLYKLFLELSLGISAEGGTVAMLLPAGLLRSQGTEALRREIFATAADLSISVLENRRRHFDIDTRFKFLCLVARVGTGRLAPLSLRVADRDGVIPTTPVTISRRKLELLRPDLSVPEVRTTGEWKLYERLAVSGNRFGDPAGPWGPDYCREVDMTNDAASFTQHPAPGDLPLLEGRHVHQYRYRAKSYVCGSGRSAVWEPNPITSMTLVPQWHIPKSAIKPVGRNRTARPRIGFCDITGQTNERSLLVARVPSGVVCGNKVPTIELRDPKLEDLFIALANSFAVDWMLRRVVTTTVNFFMLDDLPLPPVVPGSPLALELSDLSRRVSCAEGDQQADDWEIGRLRARIDALVAHAWGISNSDMELLLRDFPLLDRGQPALPGEERSTVTADFVLTAMDEITGELDGSAHAARLKLARNVGAAPYVPAGLSTSEE